VEDPGEVALGNLDTSLNAVPFGVALFDRELRYTFVNDELARINHRPAAEHIGRHPGDLFPSSETARWIAMATAAMESGAAVGPLRLAVAAFGAAYDVSYSPIFDGDDVAGVAAVVFDVSWTAALEQRQHTLIDTVSHLARAMTTDEVVDAVVGRIHGAFADRVAYGTVRDGLIEFVRMDGYDHVVVERFMHRPMRDDDPYPVSDAVRRRASVVLDGDDFDREYPQHADLRRHIGDGAVAVVPVMSEDEVLGVLVCGWNGAGRGVAADVDLIVSIAAVTGGALRRVQLSEAVASDRFRRALDASVDGVVIARSVRDDEGRIVDFTIEHANDGPLDAYGRPLGSLVGRSVLDSYPGLVQSGLFDTFRRVVETGEPFGALEQEYVDESSLIPVRSWHQLQVVSFDDGYLASTRDVTAEVAARTELEAARVTAASEVRAVELLTQIALPERLPRGEGYEVDARYEPADSLTPIGGDWFDVLQLDARRLAVIVGDVAGHGRDAAVAAVELRALMRAHVRTDRSPVAAITNVRQHADALGTMATCLAAIVDLDALRLTVSSAGHLPVVGAVGGAARLLPQDTGPPIGMRLRAADTETTVALEPRTTLVFCTDGLIERRTEPITVGLQRLCAAVTGGLTASAQCAHLIDRLPPHPRDDDLCVVAITLDAGVSAGT
jgi:PAS domain-containing protein